MVSKTTLSMRMQELKLSQSKLANRSGVTQAMISGIVAGQYRMTYGTAHKLARVLRIDPVVLMAAQALDTRPSFGPELVATASLIALRPVLDELLQEAEKEVISVIQVSGGK